MTTYKLHPPTPGEPGDPGGVWTIEAIEPDGDRCIEYETHDLAEAIAYINAVEEAT